MNPHTHLIQSLAPTLGQTAAMAILGIIAIGSLIWVVWLGWNANIDARDIDAAAERGEI